MTPTTYTHNKVDLISLVKSSNFRQVHVIIWSNTPAIHWNICYIDLNIKKYLSQDMADRDSGSNQVEEQRQTRCCSNQLLLAKI